MTRLGDGVPKFFLGDARYPNYQVSGSELTGFPPSGWGSVVVVPTGSSIYIAEYSDV